MSELANAWYASTHVCLATAGCCAIATLSSRSRVGGCGAGLFVPVWFSTSVYPRVVRVSNNHAGRTDWRCVYPRTEWAQRIYILGAAAYCMMLQLKVCVRSRGQEEECRIHGSTVGTV